LVGCSAFRLRDSIIPACSLIVPSILTNVPTGVNARVDNIRDVTKYVGLITAVRERYLAILANVTFLRILTGRRFHVKRISGAATPICDTAFHRVAAAMIFWTCRIGVRNADVASVEIEQVCPGCHAAETLPCYVIINGIIFCGHVVLSFSIT
jgi:hypothetical protein